MQSIDWPCGVGVEAAAVALSHDQRRVDRVGEADVVGSRAPVFVTVMVNVSLEPPAVTVAELNVLVRSSVTSEWTVVEVSEALLPGSGSSVELAAFAVFSISCRPRLTGRRSR